MSAAYSPSIIFYFFLEIQTFELGKPEWVWVEDEYNSLLTRPQNFHAKVLESKWKVLFE